jgi:hypothetical protein
VIIVDVCLTMESFDLLCRGPGPDSPEVTITSAYQTTQEGKGRLPLGFERGMGGLTIPDGAPVLAYCPPLIDAPLPEVALRAPVGPMHPSSEGESL